MTGQPNLIRGKVARILNARELVLNVGSKQGVELDMLFDVLDPASEDIRDPDTKAVLGSVNHPKVRVKIAIVQENLSVARTYRVKNVNVGGTGLGIRSMFEPPRWIREYETLKTEEGTWEDLNEEDSFVRNGRPRSSGPKR